MRFRPILVCLAGLAVAGCGETAVITAGGTPSTVAAVATPAAASATSTSAAGTKGVTTSAAGTDGVTTSVAGTNGVTTSAVATSPAMRVPTTPTTDCERIAVALAIGHPTTPPTSQYVIVRTTTATDTTAILQLADRSGTGWRCGPELIARVGRGGVRPLVDRRSGDDTTPAGVFPLGTMTAWDGQVYSFFGNDPDPGVGAGTYRRTRTGDCFGATPNTAAYGHLRNATNCPGPDDEYLPAVGAYTTAALIGANMEPNVSGDAPGEIPYAAAIFLHRFTYATPGATSAATKATSGCVSLAQVDLTSVLVQLRPDVQFAIGTTGWLLNGA